MLQQSEQQIGGEGLGHCCLVGSPFSNYLVTVLMIRSLLGPFICLRVPHLCLPKVRGRVKVCLHYPKARLYCICMSETVQSVSVVEIEFTPETFKSVSVISRV